MAFRSIDKRDEIALNQAINYYDTLVHLRNGKYDLIEIKLGGDRLIKKGVKSLRTMETKIDTDKMQKPSFLMVLTGTGDYACKRKDEVCVVSIGCLMNYKIQQNAI